MIVVTTIAIMVIATSGEITKNKGMRRGGSGGGDFGEVEITLSVVIFVFQFWIHFQFFFLLIVYFEIVENAFFLSILTQ